MGSEHILATLGLMLGLSGGCTDDSGVSDTSPRAPLDTGVRCDQWVTYETFAASFFLTWCTGCHGSGVDEGERQGAPTSVDLDTYVDVFAHLDRVRARTVDTRTMPPAGGPREADLDLLTDWIACGAPED